MGSPWRKQGAGRIYHGHGYVIRFDAGTMAWMQSNRLALGMDSNEDVALPISGGLL